MSGFVTAQLINWPKSEKVTILFSLRLALYISENMIVHDIIAV